MLSLLFPWFFARKMVKGGERGTPIRKPHPFAVLKGGKKTIVIGVVDSGTVGFFRFGMGAFEEMPMV
jgi:tRNA-splicing endonuclease subunit Sen54